MDHENPFHHWIDLAQPRFGTEVVYATDDFFADKSRLIDPADPVFIEGKFDDNGKWMDGWESRRKRTPGYDYCIVKLGIPGIVHGVDIDTRHFTGNYPPAASIDACFDTVDVPGDDAEWWPLLDKHNLAGNAHHYLPVDNADELTHLRLNIFPDGGIARLRVYGEIRRDWGTRANATGVDLFALENGGRALRCNDEHFGSMHNLNVAGRGVNMGDGWETARRRVPGNDWVIVQLGCPGSIGEVEIDTAHFKGNYPDRASLRAILLSDALPEDIETASSAWPLLLDEVKLDMDNIHIFSDQVAKLGRVSHVRMDIFPDGGISRLRLRGTPEPDGEGTT
jgi:allantoicase